MGIIGLIGLMGMIGLIGMMGGLEMKKASQMTGFIVAEAGLEHATSRL